MNKQPICALLLWLLSATTPAYAQHEADNWYFGLRAGFSFQSGAPVPLFDGQLTTHDACAVASEPGTGQLLFYSNGVRVWNRAHQLMPHGDSLRGHDGATQGVLIVPAPGDAYRYYLFTLLQHRLDDSKPYEGASRLHYSLIDLRLDGGRGDVVAAGKDTPLADHLTEKLTAVRHANGRDYWVLVHRWGSAEFVVYAVTDQGMREVRRQAIGPTHPALLADTARRNTGYLKGTKGYLQASPDGRQLACAVGFGTEPFSLFDFDAATGTLANYVNLGLLRDAHGVCFSPDNSKLYVENYTNLPQLRENNIISQYDLKAGAATAVAASGQSIIAGNPATNIPPNPSTNAWYGIQNGPDGRIYTGSGLIWDAGPVNESPHRLFVIGRPNARGFACRVNYQAFTFSDQVAAGGGLPNFMQHYFNGREPANDPDRTCDPGAVAVFPNPSTEVFQVQLPGNCAQPYLLLLYDAVGRQVARYESVNLASQNTVSVATLAAGLYVVELRFARQVIRKKLVKN